MFFCEQLTVYIFKNPRSASSSHYFRICSLPDHICLHEFKTAMQKTETQNLITGDS